MKQKVYTLAPGHSITPTCTPLDALTLPCWPTIRHHLTTHAAVTEIGTIHRPPPGGFAANFVREILCCPCMLHLKNQITYPPAIKHRGARQLRMRKKKNHQRSARINERSNAFVEWQRYDAAISIILLIVKLIGVHLIMLCILLRSPDEHCEYYYAMEVRIFFFPISFMFILPFVLTDSWISCVGGKNEQRYGGVAEASVFPHAHGPIGIGISGWGHTGGMKQKKIIEPNEVWGGLAYTHTTHMHALEQYQKQQTKKKKTSI